MPGRLSQSLSWWPSQELQAKTQGFESQRKAILTILFSPSTHKAEMFIPPDYTESL